MVQCLFAQDGLHLGAHEPSPIGMTMPVRCGAQRLCHLQPNAIYSPLMRLLERLDAVHTASGLPLEADERIRMMSGHLHQLVQVQVPQPQEQAPQVLWEPVGWLLCTPLPARRIAQRWPR